MGTRRTFLIEAANVRGVHVDLDDVWQSTLARADYADWVLPWLGQAQAAVALLTATIKFDGRLSLQVKGGGPLQLLVAQANADGSLRATARTLGGGEGLNFKQAVGDSAQVALTLSQRRGDDYQGVVALDTDALGDALAGYFALSEQLATQFWLGADATRCRGLLLQRLPGASEDTDGWQRVQQLASTLFEEELLSIDADVLVNRLFHEEDVRLFDPSDMLFRCGCSRERTAAMVRSLGHEDVTALLQEQGGEVLVDCEFCHQQYRFDGDDVAALFADQDTSE
ncbi:MAG: Hsp33 family molecular chaperone HslO [Pseudomonadota bacterium]